MTVWLVIEENHDHRQVVAAFDNEAAAERDKARREARITVRDGFEMQYVVEPVEVRRA